MDLNKIVNDTKINIRVVMNPRKACFVFTGVESSGKSQILNKLIGRNLFNGGAESIQDWKNVKLCELPDLGNSMAVPITSYRKASHIFLVHSAPQGNLDGRELFEIKMLLDNYNEGFLLSMFTIILTNTNKVSDSYQNKIKEQLSVEFSLNIQQIDKIKIISQSGFETNLNEESVKMSYYLQEWQKKISKNLRDNCIKLLNEHRSDNEHIIESKIGISRKIVAKSKEKIRGLYDELEKSRSECNRLDTKIKVAEEKYYYLCRQHEEDKESFARQKK